MKTLSQGQASKAGNPNAPAKLVPVEVMTPLDARKIEDYAKKIRDRHEKILGSARNTIDDAILIGQWLCEAKAQMPHGQFGRFLEESVNFAERTAQRYLMVWKCREKIKSATVSDLSQAYKMLAAPIDATKGIAQNTHRSTVPVLERLKKLWGKASPQDRKSFNRWLDTDADSPERNTLA